MAHIGRCLCGSVSLSIAGEPLGSRTCWCTDCQKFGGGNGTTNAFFRTDQISSSGDLTWYDSVADSGNTTRRAFCPFCGTHVLTSSSARPDFVGVRISMLDETGLVAPQAVIWTDSAPPWAAFDPDLPRFPKSPPVLQR